jgi:hypothetical protein
MLVTLLAPEPTEENKRLSQDVNQNPIKIIVFS